MTTKQHLKHHLKILLDFCYSLIHEDQYQEEIRREAERMLQECEFIPNLTENLIHEFLSNSSTQCIFCKSGITFNYVWDLENDSATVTYDCENCGFEWAVRYVLDNVEFLTRKAVVKGEDK